MSTILNNIKLIPVLRKIPYETSQQLIEALIDGGVQAVEITMDTERAIDIIVETIENYGDRILVGAGTVISLDDCKKVIEVGAQFIVAPIFSKEVVKYSLEHGVPMVPGVFTPTEMQQAYEIGASTIKLFPAAVLTPKFIKDVRGPLQHINIMTTGGITKETAASYLDAGAITVGVGSDLLKKKWIKEENWNAITNEVKDWLMRINE